MSKLARARKLIGKTISVEDHIFGHIDFKVESVEFLERYAPRKGYTVHIGYPHYDRKTLLYLVGKGKSRGDDQRRVVDVNYLYMTNRTKYTISE